MGMFDSIDQSTKIELEDEALGGGGNYVKDTGVYDFIVKRAYGGQSDSGAYFIDVSLETEDGKKMNVREYITSGSSKGTRPFYIDKQGNQRPLPGYAKMNALDVILTGNDKQFPMTETKTIMLWNKEAEKEIPTEAQVLTGWMGKPITALVRKVKVFKQAKNASGKYVDTDETREYAEVVHFVDAITGQTRSEKLAGKDAKVKAQFEERYNSDYVLDKTKSKKKEPAAEIPAEVPFGQN